MKKKLSPFLKKKKDAHDALLKKEMKKNTYLALVLHILNDSHQDSMHSDDIVKKMFMKKNSLNNMDGLNEDDSFVQYNVRIYVEPFWKSIKKGVEKNLIQQIKTPGEKRLYLGHMYRLKK